MQRPLQAQKGAFYYKKSKKATSDLSNPYVHSIYTAFHEINFWEKNQIIEGSIQKPDQVLA